MFFTWVACSFGTLNANDLPLIKDLQLTNDTETRVLTIGFSLQDAEEDSIEVLLRASYDEGNRFLVNTSNATGDLGWPVMTGRDKIIQWYYGDIWDNVEGKTLRLIADDHYEIDIAEILEEVDTNRMRSLLSYIAAPRSFQVDSNHLHNVRDTISDLLNSFGYDVGWMQFNVLGNISTNVIGTKPGWGNEQGTIIMDAHYDSNIDSPGADDNGSGVVGFLEAARLLAPYSFNTSLEFIGFDQEEEGLRGSIDYVNFGGIEPWKSIDGVLNFEMIGYYSDVPNSQQAPVGFDLLLPSQYAALEQDSFRGNFIGLNR
ncbi:MAG: M28 family peptidase [Bacteroidetes bacterium]|nr:M28 family peptidase [Bacteroidota bacterium]